VKLWKNKEKTKIPTDSYADRADRLNNEGKEPKSRSCLAEMEWITNPDIETSLISGPQASVNFNNVVNGLRDAIIDDLLSNE
jgi:hypothetical protein